MRRRLPLAMPIMLAALGAAPVAEAADPIEGTWHFSGGRVEVEPTGAGQFVGTVRQATRFDVCTHPVGQRMWSIRTSPDGIYRGTHIRYRTATCSEVPDSPAIWRVREQEGRQVLDFCSNDPSEGPPSGFDSSCLVLERAAPPPNRTEACAGGSRSSQSGGQQVCVDGPADLRKIGCLRRGSFRHRFGVKLKKRSRGGGLVNRRSRVQVVTFTLDRRLIGRDRRRPFVAVVDGRTLTAGPHVLRATVRLRVPGTNRRFVRRLVYRFNGCT